MAPSGADPARILLVEGSSDEHVIEHLCRQIDLLPEVEIEACGNVDELLKRIPVEIKVSGRTVVGVLADANADIHGRWQQVARAFREANVLLPREPVLTGAIVKGSPRVGVWLMPDNARQGELEDFLIDLIPADDEVWQCAQDYIESIPANIRPRKRSKAEVHAWLSGKPKLLPPGIAIDKSDGYFDTDVPLAQSLKRWLNRLFEEDS